MRCPACDSVETRVVDTRLSRGGRAVRRRRECERCSNRFTTYEVVEQRPVRVLKRDGESEEYQREKLLRSLTAACAKRPISVEDLDQLVEELEDQLSRSAGLEVSSSRISEMVMHRLRLMDRVAYVRYASVYRNFRDLDEFEEFVSEVRARQRHEIASQNQVELPLMEFAQDGDDGAAEEPQG